MFKRASSLSLLPRFGRARSGNVAIIFALASLPLMAFAGAAIDYGLVSRLQVKLQAATDATALALCQTPTITATPVLQTQAQTTMTGYMGVNNGLIVDPITVTANPRKILLVAHAGLPTFFGNFLGQPTLNVKATSQCGTPMPKTFEIALVLDNTGSMASSGGSQTKIQALQSAASSFIDYVNGNAAFASDSRISIVPFAAAVTLDPLSYAAASWVDTAGQSSYHWTNVDKTQANAAGFTSRLSIFNALKAIKSQWGWGGCFDMLPYPLDVQDGAPVVGNKDTYYVPYFAPDEPGGGTTGTARWPNTNSSTYTYNSYIDDVNGVANCNVQGAYQAAENQACKYVAARNAQATNRNSNTGLPNGPNFGCVSKPLQRLTTSSTTLKALINSLTAAGSTNIQEGMIWGWRTLSPNSVFADGAPYNTAMTNKVLILMTDGTNTWPSLGSANPNQSMYFPAGYLINADGSKANSRFPPSTQLSTTAQQRNALDALTLATCTNVKASGISVYTIGFSVPADPIDTQGLNLLQSCASSTNQAFIANDSTALIAAFNQIAKSIGALRLTQ